MDRVSRHTGRRRLSEHVDQSHEPRHHAAHGGPGRDRLGERWGNLGVVVQSTDRSVLPRQHRQCIPVSRVWRATGERIGVHRQPRGRWSAHLPRVASCRGGRVRLRGARPPQSGHRLRRPGDPIRPPHRPGPERGAQADPERRLSRAADRPSGVLARRPARPLFRVQYAVEDDRRRAQLDPGEP